MNKRIPNQREPTRGTQGRRNAGSRSLRDELREAHQQLASYRDTLATIQRAMLPQHLPHVPGLDLAVHFADARSRPVAGRSSSQTWSATALEQPQYSLWSMPLGLPWIASGCWQSQAQHWHWSTDHWRPGI